MTHARQAAGIELQRQVLFDEILFSATPLHVYVFLMYMYILHTYTHTMYMYILHTYTHTNTHTHSLSDTHTHTQRDITKLL